MMASGAGEQPIDFGWFRDQLLVGILPNWLSRAVTDEGLFLPHFDREWRPAGETHGTLVSQGRLLHNFSIGFELTRDEAYRRAVERGARFLIETFRDPDHGGWFYAVDRSGRVADDRKDSYGHAFALLGLSHAARVTGDPAFEAAAHDVWQTLATHLSDPCGGLISRATRDFCDRDDRRSQNPVMHTFEALLALSDIAPERLAEARRVAEFVFPRLLRGDGSLPELFSLDWTELPAEQGGRTDIGHQFEWAFLLSAGVERGLPTSYLAYAQGLMERGMALGYDSAHGGIFGAASPSGHVLSTRKGWWQQSEALRAMLHFAIKRGRDDLYEPLGRTLRFVRDHFIDAEHGGWFASTEADGRPIDVRKGGVFKLDYHQVALCAEAIRLSECRGTG